MVSAPIFVALWLCSAINNVLSEKYVYVKSKIPTIPCIDNPMKDICPYNRRIPRLDIFTVNKTEYYESRRGLLLGLKEAHANKKCKASGEIYACRPILALQCKDDDDYYSLDRGKLASLCEKSRSDCAGLPLPELNHAFNCSTDKRIQKFPKRGPPCQDFPVIKSDPCSKRNYKVPHYTEYNELTEDLLVTYTEKVQKLVKDEKCRTDVTETICKIVAPACTKDGTRIVDLLSKQECYKIMGCLNVTTVNNVTNYDFIMGAHSLCGHLVDGTKAEKIPISDLYSLDVGPDPSKATIQNAVSKILLFSFLYFVLVFI